MQPIAPTASVFSAAEEAALENDSRPATPSNTKIGGYLGEDMSGLSNGSDIAATQAATGNGRVVQETAKVTETAKRNLTEEAGAIVELLDGVQASAMNVVADNDKAQDADMFRLSEEAFLGIRSSLAATMAHNPEAYTPGKMLAIQIGIHLTNNGIRAFQCRKANAEARKAEAELKKAQIDKEMTAARIREKELDLAMEGRQVPKPSNVMREAATPTAETKELPKPKTSVQEMMPREKRWGIKSFQTHPEYGMFTHGYVKKDKANGNLAFVYLKETDRVSYAEFPDSPSIATKEWSGDISKLSNEDLPYFLGKNNQPRPIFDICALVAVGDAKANIDNARAVLQKRIDAGKRWIVEQKQQK